LRKFHLLFCCTIVFASQLYAQETDKKQIYQRFEKQFAAGDLVHAEKSLYLFLESKDPLSEEQLCAAYSNLGALYVLMGDYDKALNYNIKAETYISDKRSSYKALATIYVNRARILTLKKSYDSAIEYFEKGIRLFSISGDSDRDILMSLSTTYLNLGIVYSNIRNFKLAQKYFEMSCDLKIKHGLSGVAFVYQNLAKTYLKINNKIKAEEFYIKSISSFKKEYGDGYYRMAEVYFDYGIFLKSEGETSKALNVHKNALYICLKNYGKKHTLVSLSFKNIGDDYISLGKIDSALLSYQKSLIAVSKDFNDPDIFSNPSIDSTLFDIRLLDNLKSKAQTLELFADSKNDQQEKLRILKKSLETSDLALELIDRIRSNYPSEESKIYLAENEKETYLFAVHLACSLYLITNDKSIVYRMYSIAQKAKAAILRNEITGNELLYSNAIPDSLREKQKTLSGNISAYNNLVLEESRKLKPDSSKISLWKDTLFDMNREKEKVSDKIQSVFPMYHDLMRKTEPDPTQSIQKQLKKDETIVDYLVSNKVYDGKRKLYVFLISDADLNFRELTLDSLFVKDAEIIRNTADPSLNNASQTASFSSNAQALNNMYLCLVKPVENLITGKKLIIIPDEEIGWLTFDSFLKSMPDASQTDYEGIHFLIQDYTFSYGYSSSLIFSKRSRKMTGSKVFAFSPDYSGLTDKNNKFLSLKGTGTEIGSVYKWFEGKSFSGENATKSNFMALLDNSAIFHLAMHALEDSTNSRYSYLVFDSHKNSGSEARLYNYEISVSRISSPMVVLSACNSGTGTLYYGEGLMSLARGFTLAGASSVIKTAWEINDEASSSIMTRFYHFLAKGMGKNEAMHLAKLEYLKLSPPSAMHPYYWAAYEVLGDNSPVAHKLKGKWIILIVVVVIGAGGILFYFNRRRIFSDRTL
jgi:CHAT domain-containing protein